ncbi:hypothetical protein CBR_g36417 [Chara braunii]|uniref:Reverse transcriptase domain-containing protein n=1 Tax=Chara braunii TaxID=69332 RepID=A0A388LKV8_CHABU|nr:hypothetical protein CBR_g36417 [Chara braunii]|eukprot:GBG82891.1 hypothetical protein CBR_g36417 [Chara braunii]
MDAILKFLTELRKGLKVVDAFTREPAELAVERTYLDLAAQRLKRPWDQARRNGFLESPLGGQLSRNIDAALRQAELLSSQSNLGNPVVRLLYLWWKESCPAADRQRKAIAATHTLIEQRKEELALCFATLYHTFRENKEKVDTWLAQMKQQQEEQAQILSDEDDRVDYLMKTVSQFFGEMCEEFGGTVEVKIREEGEDSWHPREVYLRVPNFQPIQLEMTWTGQFYFYIFESRQAWQGKTDSRIVRLEYPRSGSDNNFAPRKAAGGIATRRTVARLCRESTHQLRELCQNSGGVLEAGNQQLGYGKDAMVQKKVVTTIQQKGKELVVKEVIQEEWEEEEPVPQHLLKTQRKQHNLTQGGQGSRKGQAPQALAVASPSTAASSSSAGPSQAAVTPYGQWSWPVFNTFVPWGGPIPSGQMVPYARPQAGMPLPSYPAAQAQPVVPPPWPASCSQGSMAGGGNQGQGNQGNGGKGGGRGRGRNGGGRGGQWDNQGYQGQKNQQGQGYGRPRFDWRTVICQHCDKQGYTIRFCDTRREHEKSGLIYSNMDGDIYDQYREYIDRKISGGVRVEAHRRVVARQAPPAMFRPWQGKDDPPIRVEEVECDEEVTQRPQAGAIKEKPIIVESEGENADEKMESASVWAAGVLQYDDKAAKGEGGMHNVRARSLGCDGLVAIEEVIHVRHHSGVRGVGRCPIAGGGGGGGGGSSLGEGGLGSRSGEAGGGSRSGEGSKGTDLIRGKVVEEVDRGKVEGGSGSGQPGNGASDAAATEASDISAKSRRTSSGQVRGEAAASSFGTKTAMEDSARTLCEGHEKVSGMLAHAMCKGAMMMSTKTGDVAVQIGAVAGAMHDGNGVLPSLVSFRDLAVDGVTPTREGELRLCIDYRGLNFVTVINEEPLPRIDDLLNQLQGCRNFSKIDLKSGYHQIEVAPEDQHKTTCQTRRLIDALTRDQIQRLLPGI